MKNVKTSNVAAAYKFYAPFYDRLFGITLDRGRKALARKVCELNPQHILEIGVGTGLTLNHYPKSATIVGVDISPEMLLKAKKKAESMREKNINLMLMDAENLDFPDNSFDCITLPYVLSVTPNPEKLVYEVCRVCKENGDIVILNHFSGGKTWWLLEKLVNPLSARIGFHSVFDFEENILKYDWNVKNVENTNIFNLSKMVLIKNAPANERCIEEVCS